MKLLDALRIGLQILAAAELAGEARLPVNWSWKVKGKRLRLQGELSAEDA